MAKLARTASGSRHLRWAREILATIKAHHDTNDLLTDVQKGILTTEATTLEGRVTALSNAVMPYREFIDHAHIEIRAKQRVGNFLCDEAQKQTDGQMRPYRETINTVLKDGGFTRIFSRLPISRVLRAGHERTVRFANNAAEALRLLPPTVPGTGALADRLELVASKLNTLLKEETDVVNPRRGPLKMAVEKTVYELREELEQMDARLRLQFTQAFIDNLYPELNRKRTAVLDEEDEDDDDSSDPEGSANDPG